VRATVAGPILFRGRPPQRTAFTPDGEGEATLKLVVSEEFARILSAPTSTACGIARSSFRIEGSRTEIPPRAPVGADHDAGPLLGVSRDVSRTSRAPVRREKRPSA